MPDALEVDLSSANGCDLLRALAQRHGEPLAAAARSLAQLFLLRAPWAPGLRFVGGTVRATLPVGIEPARFEGADVTLSVGGGGATIEDALANCIGEAVERQSQFRRPGDIATVASVCDVSDRLQPGIRHRIARLCKAAGYDHQRTFDWLEARLPLTPKTCLVPADWCLRSQTSGPLGLPGTALSTGVAAGRSFEAAALRAVLELIERDAVALWWIGGRRGHAPSMEAAATGEAHALLGALRHGRQDRVSWILDLTSDLRVPVMAALSADRDGYGLVCGFAARLDASDAVRAAIYEMCQMELGLNIAEARNGMQASRPLPEDDRARLALAREIDTRSCALLHPAGTVAGADCASASMQTGEAFPTLLRHLDGLGVEVALLDLTRPEFGIPVAAAVAPALQLMPSELVTDRLDAAIAASGGSEGFTKGLPLF
ncbi:MAG: YcaO-like family protein [Hyphomicrobiaceae bacterium]